MKKYDGVLKRVREVERKNGIIYAKPDGKLYITLKVIYSIVGLWSFFMNLFYVLGFLLMYSGTDNMKNVSNSLITVSICTAVLIAGYALNCCKLYLAGGILSVLSAIMLIPTFARPLEDSLGYFGYKASFYWRHFAPLVIMIALITWLTVLAVRAKVKTERQYKRVSENLYNMYNCNIAEGEISEEAWNSFLESYDPHNYKKQFRNVNER